MKRTTIIDMTPSLHKPRHYYLIGISGIVCLIIAAILLADIIVGILLLILGLSLTTQFILFLSKRNNK